MHSILPTRGSRSELEADTSEDGRANAGAGLDAAPQPDLGADSADDEEEDGHGEDEDEEMDNADSDSSGSYEEGRPSKALRSVVYSREATVAAFEDYFDFLTKLYLDEDAVQRPPPGGWPEITPARCRMLGLDDEVGWVLGHIPYLNGRDMKKICALAHCEFTYWPGVFAQMPEEEPFVSSYRASRTMVAEPDFDDVTPESVVSLSFGLNDEHVLLDTALGSIYWRECPEYFRYKQGRRSEGPRGIADDPYDWAPDREAEWREASGLWSITGFFEEMKDCFRRLEFLPMDDKTVEMVTYWDYQQGVADLVQGIYRKHGWPDLALYDKKACLSELAIRLAEEYPDAVPVL